MFGVWRMYRFKVCMYVCAVMWSLWSGPQWHGGHYREVVVIVLRLWLLYRGSGHCREVVVVASRLWFSSVLQVLIVTLYVHTYVYQHSLHSTLLSLIVTYVRTWTISLISHIHALIYMVYWSMYCCGLEPNVTTVEDILPPTCLPLDSILPHLWDEWHARYVGVTYRLHAGMQGDLLGGTCMGVYLPSTSEYRS